MDDDTIRNRIEPQIEFAVDNQENTDQVSWGYQEGVLITVEEAQYIIQILNERK